MLKEIKNIESDLIIPGSEAVPDLPIVSLPPSQPPSPSVSYIGYSTVIKTRRPCFRKQVFDHSPALSPAKPEVWTGNAKNALTAHLRGEFHTYLEVSLGVQSYQMKPVKIPFTDKNGQSREYQPLFILQYWGDCRRPVARHRYLLGDIRSDEDIRGRADRFIPAWQAASRWAIRNGFNFRVFRDSFFLSDYFSNVKFMRNYWRLDPDEKNWRLVNRILEERKEIKFSELIKYAGDNKEDQGRLIRAVWTLVSMGCIGADWQKRFNQNTVLWLN